MTLVAFVSSTNSSYPVRNKVPLPTKREGSDNFVTEKYTRFLRRAEARHFVDTSPIKDNRRLRPHHPKLETFVKQWEEGTHHEETRNVRFAKSSYVNYNGSHPFEIMERRRKLFTHNLNFISDDPKRRDQTTTPWEPGVEYKPIRLLFDTMYLDLESERYSAEIIFLREQVLPKLKSFWEAGMFLDILFC